MMCFLILSSKPIIKILEALADQGVSGQKGVIQNYDQSFIRVPRQYLQIADG